MNCILFAMVDLPNRDKFNALIDYHKIILIKSMIPKFKLIGKTFLRVPI